MSLIWNLSESVSYENKLKFIRICLLGAICKPFMCAFYVVYKIRENALQIKTLSHQQNYQSKLLTNTLKSKGPNIDPCGIPFTIFI